jgi:hypothetical protein
MLLDRSTSRLFSMSKVVVLKSNACVKQIIAMIARKRATRVLRIMISVERRGGRMKQDTKQQLFNCFLAKIPPSLLLPIALGPRPWCTIVRCVAQESAWWC